MATHLHADACRNMCVEHMNVQYICVCVCDSDVRTNVRWENSGDQAESGVRSYERELVFWLLQALSDRIQCHGGITTSLSRLHIITAGVEGTLVGSDPKAPSGITLISLPL